MRFVIFLTLFLGALMGGIYYATDPLLGKASTIVIDYAKQQAAPYGLRIKSIQFDRVRPSGFDRVSWYDIEFDAQYQYGARLLNLTGKMDEFTLGVKNPIDGIFFVEVKNLLFAPEKNLATSNEEADVYKIKLELINVQLRVNPTQPRAALRSLKKQFKELRKLESHGQTTVPVTLKGSSRFLLNGYLMGVRFWTVQKGLVYTGVMDKNDLKSVSRHFSRELTYAEIDLLSEHPFQAPDLLKIKKQAEDVSKRANKLNPRIPEDAYRHVFWSYTLTKRFGPALAKKVTDAHEIGSKTNTEADHRMDYNNNKVGRQYALANVPEASIKRMVMSDPEVIRDVRYA